MHIIPNVWPTLVGMAVYFVLGGLWYAGIFGKTWQAGLALDAAGVDKLRRDFPKALLTHLLSGLFTAYVIGRIVLAVGATGFAGGLFIGLWCWVGFALTVCANAWMFEQRKSSVFGLNIFFYLIAYALLGGIMGAWQ